MTMTKNKNQNLTKYQNILKKTFKLKDKDLKKDIKYNSIKQWDSVGHMNMIANLEDEFKISMDMDDIIDFSSSKKGIALLKKYKIKF